MAEDGRVTMRVHPFGCSLDKEDSRPTSPGDGLGRLLDRDEAGLALIHRGRHGFAGLHILEAAVDEAADLGAWRDQHLRALAAIAHGERAAGYAADSGIVNRGVGHEV